MTMPAHYSPSVHMSRSQTPYTTTPPNPPSSPSSTTIFPANTDEDITSALHLISDSVAQQRHIAAKSVLLHPAVLAITILAFLSTVKLLYTGSPSDIILMITAWTSCSLVGLLTIRFMIRGYIPAIERTGHPSWLTENSVHGLSPRHDEVLIAQQGNEVVGILVMRITKTVTSPDTPGIRARSSRRKSSARWTGIIRAWTVKRSHRFQGVGSRLLEVAISNCRLRTLDGPMFADDHANSRWFLPGMFNVVFDKQEKWARSFLEHAISAQK